MSSANGASGIMQLDPGMLCKFLSVVSQGHALLFCCVASFFFTNNEYFYSYGLY